MKNVEVYFNQTLFTFNQSFLMDCIIVNYVLSQQSKFSRIRIVNTTVKLYILTGFFYLIFCGFISQFAYSENCIVVLLLKEDDTLCINFEILTIGISDRNCSFKNQTSRSKIKLVCRFENYS